jgi:hypothetical protein
MHVSQYVCHKLNAHKQTLMGLYTCGWDMQYWGISRTPGCFRFLVRRLVRFQAGPAADLLPLSIPSSPGISHQSHAYERGVSAVC